MITKLKSNLYNLLAIANKLYKFDFLCRSLNIQISDFYIKVSYRMYLRQTTAIAAYRQ